MRWPAEFGNEKWATRSIADAMKTFSAVFVVRGEARRTYFEATSDAEAREICVRWEAGLEGETVPREQETRALPEAYDEGAARQLLGGISKSTLYREIQDGKLERVRGTRRILITRASLESRSRWRALTRLPTEVVGVGR